MAPQQQRTSTLRTLALGNKIRELRMQAGYELAEAARHVERDKSSVSRMETGALPIPQQVLEALLTLYGVTDPTERDGLLRFNKDAWRSGWWQGYTDEIQGVLSDYLWLEERATKIRAFSIAAFDGLLQTPEYARAMMLGFDPNNDPDQVENWVGLRMRHQVVLTQVEAPKLSVVASEAALRTVVGSPAVLTAQLRHVIDRSRQPNVEVRVVPFAAGIQAGLGGVFRIFDIREHLGQVVCVDVPPGIIYLESPGTDYMVAAYDRLWDAALDPDQSTALMTSIADELESS
jgi:transcriptional regulator with XRE-family HTH domain